MGATHCHDNMRATRIAVASNYFRKREAGGGRERAECLRTNENASQNSIKIALKLPHTSNSRRVALRLKSLLYYIGIS